MYYIPQTLCRGKSPTLLHQHSTEFKFGNFAVGIECVDGQEVGSGLLEVEGQKDTATRRLVRAHGFYHHLTTPRHHPHKLTLGNAKCVHILRRHFEPRFRSHLVQGFGAPGHRPGVPVLQHTPGVEHERICLIREFFGWSKFCRDEFPLATRERVRKANGYPRMVQRWTGPGDTSLLQARVGNAGKRWGQRHDLLCLYRFRELQPATTELISLGTDAFPGITVWTYIRTGYNAEVVNLTFSGNKLVKIELNLLKP